MKPGRTEITQYRVMSRKPGEKHFAWRRFPGSQVTGDFPLAWEHLIRARRDTPQWEFRLAIQQVVTVTAASGWIVQDDEALSEARPARG